jgi:hypothetical protein
MNPTSIIGAGIGAVGAIGGAATAFGTAGTLGRMANAITPVDPKYGISKYATERYQLAEQLLNARMPGATTIERGIQTNQASQTNSVNRTATDSATALSTLGQIQGQTNKATSNLGVQEQQDYYNREANLSNAGQGMTAELDKQYQDKLRDYQEQEQLKNLYFGASLQDKAQAWSSLASTGIGAFGIGQQMKN